MHEGKKRCCYPSPYWMLRQGKEALSQDEILGAVPEHFESRGVDELNLFPFKRATELALILHIGLYTII